MEFDLHGAQDLSDDKAAGPSSGFAGFRLSTGVRAACPRAWVRGWRYFLKFQETCNRSDLPETHDIQAVKAKDPKALDHLVRTESGRVYRCIGRMIRDTDEIQNLTQETFLQAIQNIESFRGESKISTWLCSIAINLARAHLRKSKRYDVLEESEIEQLLPTFGFFGQGQQVYTDWDPERYTERSERIEMVHSALDQLPSDYRAVIALRDLEELSTKEVGEILEISEGAVRVRLHRARQALRVLIDKKLAK